MTLSAALLLLAPIAASSAPGAGAPAATESASTQPARASSSRAAPIAVATARVQIVRAVSVRVRRKDGAIEIEAHEQQKPQAQRDPSGTLWVEFS